MLALVGFERFDDLFDLARANFFHLRIVNLKCFVSIDKSATNGIMLLGDEMEKYLVYIDDRRPRSLLGSNQCILMDVSQIP